MSDTTLWSAFLLIFFAIWMVGFLLVRRGVMPTLRDIPGYQTIRGAMAEAAEVGRPVHLSLGTAGIGDVFAMESLTGLTALEFLGEQAATTANLPLVTTGDPTTMLFAQDTMIRPFKQRDQVEDYSPLNVRFIGGTAGNSGVAYAAGVMDILNHQNIAANFMVGRFGDEYLLMGEVAARRQIPQVAGSANPNALTFMQATANQVLMGEEMFVAGAYLTQSAWHIASLLAQDTARWILVVGIGAVVLLKTLGLL